MYIGGNFNLSYASRVCVCVWARKYARVRARARKQSRAHVRRPAKRTTHRRAAA